MTSRPLPTREGEIQLLVTLPTASYLRALQKLARIQKRPLDDVCIDAFTRGIWSMIEETEDEEAVDGQGNVEAAGTDRRGGHSESEGGLSSPQSVAAAPIALEMCVSGLSPEAKVTIRMSPAPDAPAQSVRQQS